MESIDYQQFKRWLAKSADHRRIAFRVFNPKRAKRGAAHRVLDWISVVERAIE